LLKGCALTWVLSNDGTRVLFGQNDIGALAATGAQIVGKVKLALTPFLNKWWNVAFHLTARGLTTGLIPYQERAFEVRFDFVDHNLFIETDEGATKALSLLPRTVAAFYGEVMGMLRALGITVAINPVPCEVPNPIPCDVNETHASYDAAYVTRWWRIQLQIAK
jgi:Family of unknown function (DUF5996)